jgi:hypothetical protein
MNDDKEDDGSGPGTNYSTGTVILGAAGAGVAAGAVPIAGVAILQGLGFPSASHRSR